MPRAKAPARVLAVLESSQQHLTADEVAARLAETDHQVDRSTVYRALDSLLADGRLRRSRIGRAVYYEPAQRHGEHHHMTCVVCGATVHMEGAGADAEVRREATGQGFQVDEVDIVVRGRCRLCAG